MTRLIHVAVLTLAVLVGSTDLDAQPINPAVSKSLSLLGGAGWMSLWDDETFLGRGALVSGGVSKPIGGHFVAEGEVAWATHHRDAGYLSADGTPVIGTARVLYSLPISGRPRQAVRGCRPVGGALDGLPDDAIRGSWP